MNINYYYRVMRITTFLLLAGCMQLSAAGFSQTITLSGKDMPLQQVVLAIMEQTDYMVISRQEYLQRARPVTLSVRNEPLDAFLERVFRDQPLAYAVEDRNILVSEREGDASSSFREAGLASPPQETITGRVVDSTGVPLRGASVQVRGQRISTLTDADGTFVLRNVAEGTTLAISFIGFLSKDVVAVANIGTVMLQEAPSELEEVEVNAGYWKVSDRLRTGNISKVTSETITQQPVADPMMALSGRVAGLQISQTSGLPGASLNISLRGRNSIRADANNLLYIIDGVPFPATSLTSTSVGGGAIFLSPFSFLNPSEIESIEVLKDADASAVFGSRGANGVILITTKKGHIGRTTVNINAFTGIGKLTRMLDLLNTEQYLEMRREAFSNDNASPNPWDYDVNGEWDQNRYTNWQKALIGGTSTLNNIQGSISGGTNNTQFLLGGGFLKETTFMPGNFRDQKASASISISHNSTDRRFGLNLSARYLNDNNLTPTDNLLNSIFLPPNAPDIYDENGNLNWADNSWQNPIALLNRFARAKTTNLSSNLSLKYEVFTDLEAKVNLGYNDMLMNQNIITPNSSFIPLLQEISQLRNNLFATNNLNTWIIEPQISLKRQIFRGSLETMIGFTFQETRQHLFAQSASDFATDDLIENMSAAAQIDVFQDREILYRYNSIFARLNYNLSDKYILNFVGRRDGSSRFGPDNRFGNFGSIGGAWIFSNERFWSSQFIGHGKLRASYGITGNDQISDYQYLSTYSTEGFQYLGIVGLYPTRLSNNDYGWEDVKKLELGLELGMFRDNVRFAASYYSNRTGNQLVGYSLPSITGFTSIQANLPAIIQNTGLEFEVNSTNISNNSFQWTTSANVSLPRNKLVSYPDIENSSYNNVYEVGKSLFIQKSFHWLGVDPNTGIYLFDDVNGDDIISSPQDFQALKELTQNYFGGFQNNFNYKGFQLSIFFQFVKQTGRIASIGVPGLPLNQPTSVLTRWQQPGDNTDVQRFSQSGTPVNAWVVGMNNSDMMFDDASFIRLKNLSFSYQLSKSKYYQNCRLFLQSQNLLTITNYNGLDPETQGFLPPVRVSTIGIDITF